MARPRTPRAKAAVEARDKKDPGRFKNRKEPKVAAGIGPAPAWMKPEQKKVWDKFAAELPWLNASHVALLEIATVQRARLVAGEDVGVQALGLLRQCLSQMGATPADASKITVPDDEGEKDDLLD